MLGSELGELGRLSAEIASMAQRASDCLVALRVGADQNLSGFVWRRDLCVTCSHAAGAARATAAALGFSAPIKAIEHQGFASFRLPGVHRDPIRAAEKPPRIGALVLALGTENDAAPTARLGMVRAVGAGVRLDIAFDAAAEGGPVLDAAGRLLGMSIITPDGAAALLPIAEMTRILATISRAAWLGASLQPAVIPAHLRADAAQELARLVVRIAPGGPAAAAGLRAGDMLLALDGSRLTGQGNLRGFLAAAPVGHAVEATLLRRGRLLTTKLVIGTEPEA